MLGAMNRIPAIFFSPLFIASLAGFTALIIYEIKVISQERAEFRREALLQFNVWQKTEAAAQLQLSPSQCEVVQESETVGRERRRLSIHSYTLTRFMRNPVGDYFMFKFTSTGPYVKPVQPAVAKVVLKERYVEQRSV